MIATGFAFHVVALQDLGWKFGATVHGSPRTLTPEMDWHGRIIHLVVQLIEHPCQYGVKVGPKLSFSYCSGNIAGVYGS